MTAAKNHSRKRVDATTDLILRNPQVKREWKILQNVRRSARSSLVRPSALPMSATHRTLYRIYRGYGFPITDNGYALPNWRKLSPWMKAQVASLCLMAGRCKVFTITLHEQLVEEMSDGGIDWKAYLRDRLARCLRDEFGTVPWFTFVMENRSKSGISQTKIHAHGVIQILPAELKRSRSGAYTLKSRIRIASVGLDEARLEQGADVTYRAMQVASHNAGSRPIQYNGRSQVRNVWWRKSMFKLFNPEWISYSFKNVHLATRKLTDNRLAMSRSLNQEAQRLWALISLGESAISAWIKNP